MRYKPYSFLIILLLSLYVTTICGQTDPVDKTIRAILAEQQEAWNEGNIPRFMDYYWKSPELVFLGVSGPIFGWEKTLQRYYSKYPDLQAMGTLAFDIEMITKRSDSVYSVIGQYHLTREGIENLQGYFLLLLQKMGDRWWIVADSTH